MLTPHQVVSQAMQTILQKGTDENFIILQLTQHYYIQLFVDKNNNQFFCEAVSNNYLTDSAKLNVQQQKDIEQYWKQPESKQSNYNAYFDNASDEATIHQAADFVLRTADIVYGVKHVTPDMLTISL